MLWSIIIYIYIYNKLVSASFLTIYDDDEKSNQNWLVGGGHIGGHNLFLEIKFNNNIKLINDH